MSEWTSEGPFGFMVPKDDPQKLDSGLVLPPGKTRLEYISERFRQVMSPPILHHSVDSRGLPILPPRAPQPVSQMFWNAYALGYTMIDDLEPKPEPVPPPLKQSKRDEVIIGWRCWGATEHGNVALLRSMFQTSHTWPAGEPATLIPHQARYFNGNPKCHSGIHAFKTLARMRVEYAFYGNRVYGKVALWGRVYSHEHGYRAEFAYPTHLYTQTKDLAQKLRATYGCETTWDHRRPLPDLQEE